MTQKSITPEIALAFGRDVYFGHGKIEILPKVAVHGVEDIAIAFTPGVGHAVKLIASDPEAIHEQTAKDNLIALVTDGTAVLGYGDIGPRAGMPVMEGKAVMFKLLAGVDCMPLCVDARGPDHLVDLITALEPSFGGFNLEDVAAPDCFQVMSRLSGKLPVPILHDDQYGTATVITAAVINALKVTGRQPADITAVINGCGAAGTACLDMLKALGIGEIRAVDKPGLLVRGEQYTHRHWRDIACITNSEGRRGGLLEALQGADLFIGLSVGGLVSQEMVRAMARDPIVFGLANPDPEILPDAARSAGAAVAASGRFDYPNHCNNVLAFPALMRGALDTKAKVITREMCLAAARAIAGDLPDEDLHQERILPSPMSATLYPAVAEATARAAVTAGQARHDPGLGWVYKNTQRLRRLAHFRQESLPAFGYDP